jgi:Xaa-Pro aminopeptidase
MPINREFSARARVVAEGLEARQLDGLLLTLGPNLTYLSGFTGSNGALLVTPRRRLLFTDPRYTLQAGQETDCEVRTARKALLTEVASAIRRLKLKRLAYEPARMTCEAMHEFEAALPLGTVLVPVTEWIERQRMVKSPTEIDAIRRSVRVNSEAYEQVMTMVKPGMSERDIAAELEYRMRRLGAEKPSFETIVASGKRTALPHAQPTSARLKPRDMLLVDMGAFLDGYASDMTRTAFVGTPTRKAEAVYAAVLEAQLTAIEAVRPGLEAYKVDQAARRVLREFDLDDLFTHSTGHGLGLEIHEPPRLGRRDRTLLEVGMAITIEPGVYHEDFGGIRIEDTVLVTATGCEVLTPTSKELRVLG